MTPVRYYTGGGSGSGGTGNVAWGPDFGEGEGSDDQTFAAAPAIELGALTLAGGVSAASDIDLDALNLAGGGAASTVLDLSSTSLTGGGSTAGEMDATAVFAILSPEESWVGRPGQVLSPAGNNDQTQLQLHGLLTAERDIYVKFPTSNIAPGVSASVTGATLRIFQVNGLLLDLGDLELHTLAEGDEGWDETTISKANAPASASNPQSASIGGASGDKAVALNSSVISHLESRIDAGVDTTFLLRTDLLGVLLRSFQSADASLDPFATVAAAQNPVTYLRLGEDSGSFSDSGSNALSVTDTGVTRNSAGLITSTAGDDGAVESSNGTTHVHVGDNYDFTSGDFSVACWVRLDDDSTDRGIVRKRSARASGDGWSVHFNSTVGAFEAGIEDSPQTTTATGTTTDVGAGITYLVGMSFEDASPGLSTVRVYLNGIEDGSGTGPATPPNTANNCRACDRQSDEVDEVLIFDRLLTDQEWIDLFDAGRNAGDDFGPRLSLTLALT